MPRAVVYTPRKKDGKTLVKQVKPKRDNLLKYWRIVRYWAKRKYDIKPNDLEIILFLYDEELFTRGQFRKFEGLFAWDRTRFNDLKEKGYIVTWRERKTKDQSTLYTLSVGAKRIVDSVYKKLTQEEHIPENKQNNPIFRGDNYMDKVYRKAIKRMNMERDRKLREERANNV